MLPIFSSIGSAASTVGNTIAKGASNFATNAAKPYTNLFKGGELSPTGEVIPSAGQQVLNMFKERVPGLSELSDITGMNESHAPISNAAFETLHPEIKSQMEINKIFKGPETMKAPVRNQGLMQLGGGSTGLQEETSGGGGGGGIANGFLKGFSIG